MNLDDKRKLGKLLARYCDYVNEEHEDCIDCYDRHFLEYKVCPVQVIAEKIRDEIIDEVMEK